MDFFFSFLTFKVFLEERDLFILVRILKGYGITMSDPMSSGLLLWAVCYLKHLCAVGLGHFSSSFHSFQITCLAQSVCSLHLVMLIRWGQWDTCAYPGLGKLDGKKPWEFVLLERRRSWYWFYCAVPRMSRAKGSKYVSKNWSWNPQNKKENPNK